MDFDNATDSRTFIREFRSRNNLTQAQAARLVGVAPNSWARWEAGHRRPSASTLRLLRIMEHLPVVYTAACAASSASF